MPSAHPRMRSSAFKPALQHARQGISPPCQQRTPLHIRHDRCVTLLPTMQGGEFLRGTPDAHAQPGQIGRAQRRNIRSMCCTSTGHRTRSAWNCISKRIGAGPAIGVERRERDAGLLLHRGEDVVDLIGDRLQRGARQLLGAAAQRQPVDHAAAPACSTRARPAPQRPAPGRRRRCRARCRPTRSRSRRRSGQPKSLPSHWMVAPVA